MKEIRFFASPEDIRPVLERFEKSQPIKFVEMGMRTDDNRGIYLESDEVPEAGQATDAEANFSQAYLVTQRETKVSVREMEMNDGRIRKDVVAGDNEEAVTLNTGGIWTDEIMLPGRMTAMHSNAIAEALLKDFRSAVRKENFEKVGEFWVGPEAMEWLKEGKRLAAGGTASDPVSLDLKLPADKS